VLVATGIGSGIGAIFGAPLGGAVLAAEILYRDDFDPGALLPCFIASGVSFVVFGAFEGYSPLFGYFDAYHFSDPVQLSWFALIGVLGGLIGLLYAKGFYGMVDLFQKSPLPKWANPAIGGLIVGSIGIAIPEVLGTGYGFIQKGLGPDLHAIPLWVVLILPFARILSTGLSIGSGGSGGIFGPGMIIGAFVGAAVWRLFEPIAPSMGHDPAPYVIVGMMCCFGSISRAPVAVMLMVAEMTGSLSILAPAMIAVGLAWFIVRRGDDTIYRSQLKNRADAPAQRLLAGLPLLAAVPTTRAMAQPRLVLEAAMSRGDALSAMQLAGVRVAPVVDRAGRFEGTVGVKALEHQHNRTQVLGDELDTGAASIALTSRLDVALESLATAPLSWAPVLDNDRRVVGTLSISDVVHAYRRELTASAERVSQLGGEAGTIEMTVEPQSRLVGVPLRDAGLPNGVLITSIRRGDGVVVPSGDTIFAVGDCLVMLGQDSAEQWPVEIDPLGDALGP
jgi:CIC family chloride channel protein